MANSWQAVQDEVMRRINSREWPPGELIPNELEIAEELGCARVTVNRALRSLAEKGYLNRKRKAGTRVIENPVRKATLVIPVTRLEVEARGSSYDHRLLEREILVPPAIIQSRMGLPDDQPLLYLRTLHLADGQPYLYEERWANTTVIPELETVDLNVISTNEWLVNNAPFIHGDISWGACKADESLASLLQCEVGDALLETERSTWGREGVITAVRMVNAPRYRIHSKL